MAKIIALLIAVLSGLIIIIPLFTKKGELEEEIQDELDSLQSKKESLYEAIKDLEFEYIAGKIDKKSYQNLKERLEMEAARVLKKIDRTSSQEPKEEIEEKVEEEIRKLSTGRWENQKEGRKRRKR